MLLEQFFLGGGGRLFVFFLRGLVVRNMGNGVGEPDKICIW